ncbi:MAG TPA: DUF4245 domain-containing protein [Actinomycetospora sp.]|uniref:DUF4245 domain-containing protein n=1 Tax=Actinomycetospora sp. TaxID=1872135 RepID=UPI002F42B3C3
MSAPRGGAGRSGIGPLVIGTIVLAVIVLALTGLTRACSFSPTSPSVDRGAVQRIDVAQVSRDAARTVPFAVRAPAMPADWIAQSSDVRPVGGGRAFRLGWVTPENAYLRLVQSNAPEDALVASEQSGAPALGPVSAGGLTWTSYPGVRGEAVWVTEVGGVRWLVTGDATPARFTQLVTTALGSPVVPRG